MSPAVGRDGHRLTHSVTAPNGTAAPSGKDSFLNYFFGKENGVRDAGLPGQSAAGAMQGIGGSASRHVSQNLEPSIAASFRRGDTRPVSMPEPPVAGLTVEEMDAQDLGFVSPPLTALS